MGTIVQARRKDGSIAYRAQILIMRARVIVHRESKTFDRRAAAAAWLKRREDELAQPEAVLGVKTDKRSPTLGEAIDRYIAESKRAMGKTKRQVLNTIKSADIADRRCESLASHDIVEFARELSAGRGPATVQSYLSHMGAVFAVARPAWGYPLSSNVMDDALVVCRRLGLVGKGNKRERRPTLKELDAIMGYFADRRLREPDASPMCVIVAFAIFSTRRLDEIVTIRWADLAPEGDRILVRDMKDPQRKGGNDIWVDLPEPAQRIVAALPKSGERILPYGGKGISAAFTRACKFLEIEDLHFHDLRHEGVSRLFELGNSIPRVAAVSGHRSWASLQRYTHLRQTGDKFAGWPWLDRVIEQITAADELPKRRQRPRRKVASKRQP